MNQPVRQIRQAHCKQTQGEKGFSQLILIIVVVAVLVVGGGGFWYYRQSAEPNKSVPGTPMVTEPPSVPTEQPKQQAKEQARPQTTEVSKPEDKPITKKEPTKEVAQQPPQSSPTTTPAPTPAPTPPTCDLTPRPRQFSNTPYYTGSLFDAHFHVPKLSEVSVNNLLCTSDKEKVKGTILFYFNSQLSLEKRLAEAESIKNDSSGKIRLFLAPMQYNLKTLEDIEAAHKGLFIGYGEMAFYDRGIPGQSYYPQSPDDQQFLDLYVLAGKNNFVVMIHPDKGQERAIENVLQKYPNVKFYFHGPEIEDAITGLMDKYPNVYYSIDAMLSSVPSSYGDALHSSMSEEEYVSKVTGNFNAILQGALNAWKTKIEKHPDRFTWGTDRGGFTWHYGEEVSRLFEELSRAFIGRLDLSVQEKYAYKNAEALLQKK